MANHRSRYDIIAAVLKAAMEGAKKTHVMYRANLSYEALAKYLSQVVQSGLVEFGVDDRQYRLTSKGQEFLMLYKEYSKHDKLLKKKKTDFHSRRMLLEELCSC